MLKIHKNNFDFLRLLAATCVVFGHSFLLTNKEHLEPFRLHTNLDLGGLSVTIFFLISGYLVSQSFEHSPANYIRNRALRIYPALLLNVLITFLIFGAVATSSPLTEYFHEGRAYLSNLTILVWYETLPGVFKDNPVSIVNGPLWTLGAEIICYAIVWMAGKIPFDKVFIVLVLVALFILLNELHLREGVALGDNYLLRFLPQYNLTSFFIIGAAYYHLRDRVKYKFYILVIFGVISLFIIKYADLFLGLCLILPYLVFYLAFNNRIKLHNIAKYGDFSYGIYIYGYIAQQSIIGITNNSLKPLELFMYSYPLCLLCAALSWHLIEKQALKFKRASSL